MKYIHHWLTLRRYLLDNNGKPNGTSEEREITSNQVKSQRQVTGGSDSGQGSEADDGIRMAYHFYIPNHLCGRLILFVSNFSLNRIFLLKHDLSLVLIT